MFKKYRRVAQQAPSLKRVMAIWPPWRYGKGRGEAGRGGVWLKLLKGAEFVL